MDSVFGYLNNILKLNKSDVIVLANSSGPDSMALVHVLLEMRKQNPFKIICAHVNHNIREESKEEAEFLRNFCEKNDIIFEYMIIERYGEDNFHNEARTVRYSFFDRVVEKYSANYLMTAHHGDDLIETILMRIARGSTLSGYAGFRKELDYGKYRLVRPLQSVTKEQILDYNSKNKIDYRIDKSNFKGQYTRNRYRSVILPFLKAEDNNIHEKFLKFSEMLFLYDEFIEKETIKHYEKVYCDNVLNITEYNKLDKIIKYKIISKILSDYYMDDLFLINDLHLDLIQKLINSKKNNTYVILPNSVFVIKEYEKLKISRSIEQFIDYEIELENYVELPNGHIIKRVFEEDSNDNSVCRISSTEVVLPLHVRTRKMGDRMSLKKIEGSKKVKDIFIDSKIPLLKRDVWPIVVDSCGKIIWIPGIKKSKFTKSKTEKYDIIFKYQ